MKQTVERRGSKVVVVAGARSVIITTYVRAWRLLPVAICPFSRGPLPPPINLLSPSFPTAAAYF